MAKRNRWKMIPPLLLVAFVVTTTYWIASKTPKTTEIAKQEMTGNETTLRKPASASIATPISTSISTSTSVSTTGQTEQTTARAAAPHTVPAVQAPIAAAAPVSAPAPQCFTASFHVTESNDSCEKSRHVLKLGLNKEDLGRLHPDSVCIKAGDKPVRFEAIPGKPDEFAVAVKKHEGTLTARYCFASVTCHDGCSTPPKEKDEFLQAIGGSEDQPAAGAGVWKAGDSGADVTAKLDGDVKKELSNLSLSEDEEGRAPASAGCYYRRWEVSNTSPASCAKKAGG